MLPFQVTNSPFNEQQVDLLNRLWPTLTPAQKLWLSGYLAATEFASTAVQQEAHVSKEITILYGSQTGNAQKLAEKTGEVLKSHGFHVHVLSMLDFKPNDLKKNRHVACCR